MTRPDLARDRQRLQPVDSSLYARNLARARAVALKPSERPKRFIVADALKGPVTQPHRPSEVPVPPQMLDDALETVRLLGANTVEAESFGNQSGRIARRAGELGFSGFRRAVLWPGAYMPWDPGAARATMEQWAKSQADIVRHNEGVPPARVRLFHMADEPSWVFPKELEKLRASPSGLRLFRSYLRERGLQPSDLGQPSWGAVVPIGQSAATSLPSRKLFYWTTRFIADSFNDTMRRFTQALRRRFSPRLQTTTNWNNGVSVSYYRTPGQKVANNPDVGPDTGTGSPHWMDTARARGVSTMWSEDWFSDRNAQFWGVYADGLRSAAKLGPGSFGGFIVGRELGAVPGGAKYKALTLIGHGAKVIEWYTFGPEERFADNGYSNNEAAYGQIAAANRLIAAGEDLLYPGRPPQPRVALLVSRSAQLWNVSAQKFHADTNQPLYERELYGLHHALTHAHHQVGFVDEEAVAAGQLRAKGFQALYVTAPNVSAAAQRRIREWVSGGGVVALSPGAGRADEYNSGIGALGGMRAAGRAATRSVGRGKAVSYGFWPGNEYYSRANGRAPNGLRGGWNAATRRAAVRPARLAGAERGVSANREIVEVQRLDSGAGTAVVLLNWTGAPISAITVRVKGAGAMRSAESVGAGRLTMRRAGADALVTLPLRDVDVLKLRR